MTKFELRQEYLAKRQAMQPADISNANALITLNLRKLLIDKTINIIHTFLPQRNATEVDTWEIVSLIREAFPSMQIAAPYIIPGTREMLHYFLQPETTLIENRWRIPEPDPVHAQIIEVNRLDAVLIPLLAFANNGFRVGYGGGYYDRFLSQCKPETLKVGLSFFPPVQQIDDLDQHDVPMDVCITPYNIYKF